MPKQDEPRVIAFEGSGPDDPLTVQVSIPKHPGWVAKTDLVRQGSAVVIGALRVEPEGDDPPAGGITGQLLRDVPLSRIGPAAAGLSSNFVGQFFGEGYTDELERGPRRGPRGYPDEFYAAWARLYLEECMNGVRYPITALAEQRGVSAKWLREVIFKARERGLLSGSRQGLAGGVLTPLAKKVLRGKTLEKLIQAREP